MRISNDHSSQKPDDGGAGRAAYELKPYAQHVVPPHLSELVELASTVAAAKGLEPKAPPPADATSELQTAAFATFRVTRAKDIGLTPGQFVNALRDSKSGKGRRPIVKAFGDRVPHPGSRERKALNKVTECLRDEVKLIKEDQKTSARLSEWFASLSTDAQANIQVGPLAQGMGAWMQPLIVRVGNDATQIFNAHYLMDLPPEILAALPEDQRAWLDARTGTWNALGIDNGSQAKAFVDEYFEITDLDARGPLPFELERICELEPGLRDMLLSLQDRGLSVAYIKATHTPDAILDKVSDLRKLQKAYVSNWLRDLIQNGDMPTITANDVAAIADGHMKAHRKAHKRVPENTLEAQLTDDALAEEFDERLGFVEAANLISSFSSSLMGVVQTGISPPSAELAQINRIIHEYVGSEWAARRVGFDDSFRVGESVRETIKMLMAVSPIAEVVQRLLHLDGVAKFMAGSADNIIAEKGDLDSWAAAGVPKSDILKRAGFMVPVVLADLELSTHVDEIAQKLGPHVGGGAFSLSAVLLPLCTTLFSIQYFATQYRRLDKEGKLKGSSPLNPKEREELDDLASKEGLIRRISEALDKHNAKPAVRETIIEGLRQIDTSALNLHPIERKASVSRLRATGAAMREVMVVNQAQIGLVTASLLSIALGTAAGDLVLHDATIETLLGAAELPFAFLSLKAVKQVHDHGWKRDVKRLEPRGLLELESGTTEPEPEPAA
ncbi:hypothetical protein LJR230_003851 [Trinickia sp. LjRoot230]|uniref:hypothetical protein n=1 Tax=Trinickia sp. LjRoot230 TaxID=3342288 RepID=UPI003ECFE0CD